LLRVVSSLKLVDFLFAGGGEHHLVHLEENLLHGVFVLLILVLGKLDELGAQVFLDIECDFLTSMTVKDTEKADSIAEISLSDM